MVSPNTTNSDNTRQRFLDARERYNQLNQGKFKQESLASDSNADEVMMATTLDYLRKMAERNDTPRVSSVKVTSSRPVADNQNKLPGLPVPLPVVPVAPEQLIIQEKTNKLIDRLAKSTSKERTLQAVVETLVQLTSAIETFTQAIIDKFGDIAGHWTSRFDEYADETKKGNGWLTRVVRSLLGRSDHHQMSFAEALQVFTAPIIKATKGTYELLKRQASVFAAVARNERIDEVRATVETPNALTGMSNTLFPEGSTVRKVIDIAKAIGSFFKSIGDAGAEKLKGAAAGGGIVGAISGILSKGIIVKVLGVFGSLAGFLTAVAGGATFASVYALFRNPDQLTRLFGAFGTLLNDVIIPTLTWITTDILPPLGIAFTALGVAMDKLLVAVGTEINEALIYLIGTTIPAVAGEIARQAKAYDEGIQSDLQKIKNVLAELPGYWNSFEEWWDYISLSTRTFFSNLKDKFVEISTNIYKTIESLILKDIPNFFVNIFNDAMNYIKSLSPLQFINDKIQAVIDWFTSEEDINSTSMLTTIKNKITGFFNNFTNLLTGWIPSWEDMKGWVSNIIPSSVPEWIKSWFSDRLSGIQEKSSEVYESGKSIANSAYVGVKERVEPVVNFTKTRAEPARRDLQTRIDNLPLRNPLGGSGSIIIAPQTNNTTTTNNNVNGGGIFDRIGIGSTTPPMSRLDEMIFRANPF